ncbi:MAG TPA: hypothetical protein VD906_13775 [Caulobacteraceae bacterium]|nr:hypothetical protein [Caulobacteraceae bacterium]
MSALDLALLAAILALATWRLVAPSRGRRARLIACAATALLAVAQLVIAGFTWQFVTGWALLAATALPVAARRRRMRVLGGLGLTALLALAAVPWLVRPALVLPQPTGPHAVGTRIFRLVDPAREEPATPEPADRRQLNVQAWYPAEPGGGGRAPYIDGLGRLPPRISVFPSFIFARGGETDTRGVLDAPLSRRQPAWPVVVFSHGWGAIRGASTGLAVELASRGYIVLALDHPYESAVAELADGRVVATTGRSPDPGEDWPGYMLRLLQVRVADVRFVVDGVQAGRFGPGLDAGRIAAIGHSFGGATAAHAAGEDPRLRASANLDGAVWSQVAAERFRGPFLLVQSDRAETGHGDFFDASNRDVLDRAAAGAWRYEIARANHFSFTDAPLSFTRPGQWLVAQVMGGGRGAPDTIVATADLLDAFLSGPLKGAPGDIAAAARRHPGVRGARIR